MEWEDYFKKNREKLDLDLGNYDAIWDSIAYKKQKTQRLIRLKWQWVAASLLIFVVLGFLVRHELVVQKQISSLSQINKELAERELIYKQQVNQKWAQYSLIKSGTTILEPMLIDELKCLDTLYQSGLDELKQNGFNERAVMIMLDTYEKRLRIIEQLIYEKQKKLNYESKPNKIEI